MAFPINPELFNKYSKDAAYIIQCDTCQQIFLQTTVEGYAKLIDYNFEEFSNSWSMFRGTLYQEYLDACKHWIEHDFKHNINVYVKEQKEDVLNMDLIFAMSDDLRKGLFLEKSVNRSKAVLLADLKILENKVGQRL